MKSYKPAHLQKKIKVRRKALKRKRFLMSRLFFDIVLAIVFVVLLIYFVFFSAVFKIKNIQIISSLEVPQESINQIVKQEMQKNVLLAISKDSFFLLDTSELAKKISNQFPQIRKVDIKKGLFGNLFIEAKPRIAQSIWCFGESTTTSCFLVDQERIIFSKIAPNITKDDLIYVNSELAQKDIFSQVCTSSLMERIIETNKVLNSLELTNSIFIEKLNKFLYVKTIDGFDIYFNQQHELAGDMLKLKIFLEKEITKEQRKTLEYIDLRFSKAYYK